VADVYVPAVRQLINLAALSAKLMAAARSFARYHAWRIINPLLAMTYIAGGIALMFRRTAHWGSSCWRPRSARSSSSTWC